MSKEPEKKIGPTIEISDAAYSEILRCLSDIGWKAFVTTDREGRSVIDLAGVKVRAKKRPAL